MTTWKTEIIFEGDENCEHSWIGGNDFPNKDGTRSYPYICSLCTREELRTGTFTFESAFDPYTILQSQKIEIRRTYVAIKNRITI
jgi:hypothetical protein